MPPQTQTAPQVPLPVAKIGKLKGSYMIVQQSWALLKQDKEILLFPVVSSVVSLIAFLLLLATIFFVFLGADIAKLDALDETSMNYLNYVFLFVYYLIMFFIANFFQAGLYIIAHARFSGQNMTFSDGIHGAMAKSWKIFVWSLISATVGLALRMIADRSKIIGQIVVVILGAAWSIMTYFSLPALIIGDATVVGSFKESAALIRKTWGEVIIVNLGAGLYFTILIFGGISLGILAAVLVPHIITFIIVGILVLIYVIVLSIVSTALSSIFKLAIYEYARTGNIPAGFSPELVQSAIKAK